MRTVRLKALFLWALAGCGFSAAHGAAPADGLIGAQIKMTMTVAGGSASLEVYSAGVVPSSDIPNGELERTVGAGTHTQTFTVPAGQVIYFSTTASNLSSAALDFHFGPGYRLEINDVETTTLAVGNGSNTFVLRLIPKKVGSFSGRAGTATPVVVKDGLLQFEIALGELRDGTSAGAVAIATPAHNAFGITLNPYNNVYYSSPSEEVSVLRDEYFRMAQIITPQVGVVFPIISGSGGIEIYPRSAMDEEEVDEDGYRIFSGNPFAIYSIVTYDESSWNKVKILSEIRSTTSSAVGSVVRNAETKIVRTGSAPEYTWTIRDWYTTGQTPLVERVYEWDVSGSYLIEKARVRPYGSSTDASYSERTLAEYDWGVDVLSVTEGSSNAVTKTFAYYEDSGVAGSYGQVKSISTTGGGWEAFEYHSTKPGVVTYHHKPYNGYPSSVPGDINANTYGEITRFTYDPDAFDQLTRPTLIETTIKPNGGSQTTTAKTVVTYSTSSLGGGQDLITATRDEYTGASTYLTTVRKYFEEDNAYNRGLPRSIQYPDGRKDAFVYEDVYWDGSTFGWNIDHHHRLIVTVHGVTEDSGNSYADTFLGYSIDPVYLVAGKSTAELSIYDDTDGLAKKELRVWDGDSWESLTYSNFTNSLAHQVLERADYPGGISTFTYSGEQKVSSRPGALLTVVGLVSPTEATT